MEPVTYTGMPLSDLLDAFSSTNAVPGGGSAAALAGAVGASLLLMVAGLPPSAKDRATDLRDAAERTKPLRDELRALVDRDSDAYGEVMSALRLPKGSADETVARTAAIEHATRRATEVPLDTMRACRQALRSAMVVAASGSRRAASDVGVAIELLLAGVRGARLNVDANLATLQDADYKVRIGAEAAELERDAVTDAANARRELSGSA